MMQYKQEQNQKQRQKLSQEQRLFMELLSMNSVELAAYLEEQHEKNPLLDFDRRTFERAGSSFEQLSGKETGRESIQAFLLCQKGMLPAPVPEDIAEFLIWSLDSNGYLRMSNAELVTYFPGCTEEDMERLVKLMQQMEPTGVFARDLQECLELQLLESESPYRNYALRIVRKCMGALGMNRLAEIERICGYTAEDVRKGTELIRSLNPRPAAGFGVDARYLHCDIRVTMVEGRAVPELLNNYEALQLHSEYYQQKDEQVEQFLKPYMEDARQLLHMLGARDRTLLLIAGEILRRQQEFFLRKGALRPMTLKMIGEELGISESAISRAVADKSLEFGNRVIPLKCFFQSRTAQGTSRDEVLAGIRKLISEEDPGKPLSDQKLADLLSEMGLKVSRRAIAKYRDKEGIPAASQRRLG